MAIPHLQWSPGVAEDAKTTPTKNPSIIQYEIMITMTKSEGEEDVEAKPTAGCGEQSSPCHSSGKAALSLGVAELEKTEGQRHQKPARPASRLSACKEFQDFNRLHEVETCQVCSLIATPATESPTVLRGLESSPREGAQRNRADPGHSQNGTLVEGKGDIALETSANSETEEASREGNGNQLQPQSEAAPERDLPCPNSSMEKVASNARSHQSKPGDPASSPSPRWKKNPPDSVKKTPFGKVSAASQSVEGEGARASSPSKVSKLLEAWEKGLVGMETTATETRPSRSPVPARRLPSPPEGAHVFHPTNFRNSLPSNVSSMNAKRCLSPENAKQSFSPTGKKKSTFSGDAKRSCSPDPRLPSGPTAENRRSRSPAEKRKPLPPAAKPQLPPPLKAKPTQVPRSHSPLRRKDTPSGTENPSFSSLDGTQHSSSMAGNRSSYSVAEMRRLYSRGSTTVDTRRPLAIAVRRSKSPSSNARSSPSPAVPKCSSPSSDLRSPPLPPDNGWFSSSADARCLSPAQINSLPLPPDALLLAPSGDNGPSSSAAEAEVSPSPVDSRSFSPIAVEGRPCSPGPQRNFTAHGPVFAQVYSRLPKPKCLVEKETQDGVSTRVAESPGDTHSPAALHNPDDAGFQKESQATNTNGPQEQNLDLPHDGLNGTVSRKEGHTLKGDGFKLDTGSLKETNFPGAFALQSLRESSPNNSSSISLSRSSGRNYTSSASGPAFSEEPCVFKPVPQVLCSTTVAKSHAQWYSPKGNNTVVFRAQQQVVVPQPGCSTVYQVGREVVMSAPESGNNSQSQRDEPFAPGSNTSTALEETWSTRADLPKSPQRVHSYFPASRIFSTPESQPENGMTHSQNANVGDAQRPRCVPTPSPDRTSNGEADLAREGAVVPLSAAQRDGSLPRNSASQKHSSNLFAGSRSEQEPGMPTAGGLITNRSNQDSSWLGVGKASLSAKRRNKCSSDTAEEIGISAASQPTSPGDPKARTQDDELKKEKQVSGKSPLIFALEEESSPDGSLSSFSWPEPPSDLIRSFSQIGETEPEEAGEMEHFVDTLRNMDPAELRKPPKSLSRSSRPSTLTKHTILPPIDENHVAPKSKASFPTPLSQLFSLTQENPEEGTGSKGEEPGLAEEDTEEIENSYLTNEEKARDSSVARRSSSWESQQYKTEEDLGPFLGKFQQSREDIKASVSDPRAVVNRQPNLKKTNVLAGMSLLSNFVDRKVVEDKPYSRLDNSFLYSKFISPERAEAKGLTKRKEMSPVIQKNRSQAAPNAHQQDAGHKGSPLTTLHARHHFRALDTDGGSKQIILLSKEAETLTQSEIQGEEHTPLKINKRPSKIILYSEAGFGGQKREIWNDVPDATSWKLGSVVYVQVIRGSWLMYEKPRFHGRKCVLAEGNMEISNPWSMYCKEESEKEDAPFRIGSLKRVVQDFRLPEITLFEEENGEGKKQRFTDSAEDLRTCGQPLKAASIIVHAGLWLVYSKPFFDDDPYVLEPGGYPNLQAWGAKDPSICSMHPIKLSSPVVETPAEPKALIFERPHFQGHSWEVNRDIYSLRKPENNQDSMMSTAGSLKIIGGCWVGYEKEGFRGHQYLLEEGEYCDWTDWAGYNEDLLSLRLIRTDFVDPAIVLFEAMDFEDGPSVELSEALPDVELANYGIITQSIHVLNGVWVAYEGKNFSGKQYILEKGVYRNCEDWGANSCQISSVQPVLQVGEHSLFFISKIQLFPEPDFSGNSVTFKEDQATLPENFIPHSCRVSGGSWILYDGHQFDGEQHILSEGEYPTLSSMGCAFTPAICSLKKIPIFFSEPSIFLHGLECFEGKEIELNSEVRSLKAEGFNNHVLSVRVKGGIWVLCEHSDFRGRQWVLECIEITNWPTYSGVQHIGSLYPIKQRRVYFRIKNQELKSFLSVPDDVEDMKAGRVLVSEISDQNSSIWYYEEGLIKNHVAPNMSLQVIGAAAKGTKVVLWSESRMPRQTWRIDSSGRICSQMFEDKVLDVKGGRTYDRDHAVLWESSEERPTQIWDVQVL
ncbi:beta/gamma crystallin domain-containing protein 2 [Pseudonaja textilis]|uniref:beta/gamma crystallin domain-containing protein 2 n=1 Tax=Pseudonaja textilis TaxID=8673 RepID=UPI000EAABAAF|nr:beta/gamma crystallin domain-containing protein 2 [Pseudonaja textilis]